MRYAARARAPQLEDLVHLLLIFCYGRDDFDLAQEMLKLFDRCARISRHCIGTEQRNRKHACIEPRTVVAQNEHSLAGLYADLLKPGRAGQYFFGVLCPGGFLPDSTLFFANSNIRPVA